MYALLWLCVIASVCSAGAWLWKLLINLDIRQDNAPALWALELAFGALLLWCGQGVLGSEAPRYERGEATFITFWILLSGVCLFGPFARSYSIDHLIRRVDQGRRPLRSLLFSEGGQLFELCAL